MDKFKVKKEDIAEKLADYIIENGMKESSLRQLASRIGTSDRMLIHYFKDKETLMTTIFDIVIIKLINVLKGIAKEKMTVKAFVLFVGEEMNSVEIAKFMKVSLELISLSITGENYYKQIGKNQINLFYEWIYDSLDVDDEMDKTEAASFLLALIEGTVLLHSLNEDDKIEKSMHFIEKMK